MGENNKHKTNRDQHSQRVREAQEVVRKDAGEALADKPLSPQTAASLLQWLAEVGAPVKSPNGKTSTTPTKSSDDSQDQ